jgi:hypothetical protein
VNAAVSLSITAFLLAIAVWGIALAAVGRRPERTYLVAVVIGQVELVLQGLVAVGFILAGHEPESLGEYLGYLMVTVALLPFAFNRGRVPEATRWDSAVIGVVAFAVAIAVIRLLSLW